MSPEIQLPYTIYLLRFWLNRSTEPAFYFSLQDPHTGVQRGFATLEELMIFLQQEIAPSLDNREVEKV